MQKQVLIHEAMQLYQSWHQVHQQLQQTAEKQQKERLLYEERALEKMLANLLDCYQAYQAYTR